MAGIIRFIGLVIPPIPRLTVEPDYHYPFTCSILGAGDAAPACGPRARRRGVAVIWGLESMN